MAKIDLDTLRHSTAHLMAQAIKEIYPDKTIKLGIGPTIEHGFYYDIDTDFKILDEDLSKIEKKMLEIIKRGDEIKRFEVSKEDAIKLFTSLDETYKLELIQEFSEEETISYYSQGENFVDLCRGPHVETTRHITPFFKLLNTAGAYWRGSEKNPMLQRIYAACFDDKKKLKEHLQFLEEAKKRDHRKLGKELELFHFDPSAPGSPFFEPKGTIIYNELVQFMRTIYSHFGYQEVITPQILDVELWKTSGHWDNYHEDMFFSKDDHREMAVKPMNCPCHMLMFSHKQFSYRDLPLRYADFGRLHRNERSGTLAGLTRVRTFCQDDAHIFLAENQIQEEVIKLLKMFSVCYEHFGFTDIQVALSTRPEKKVGDDKTWDIAETALEKALKEAKYEYTVNEGDGAFYGPKIDIKIADAIGRRHQLGTVQLDFQLPERFNLNFRNSEGNDERPVVIHRALLGSLERFIGVYTEHCAGIFPFWLAPKQVVIIPVNNELHLEYCQKLNKQLKAIGIRSEVDNTNETLGKKTRNTQKAKTPYMIVVGDNEQENSTATIRAYGQKATETLGLNELIERLSSENSQKIPAALEEL